MRNTAISNTDDILDSRNIEERIEELESEIEAEEISEENGAEARLDDDGNVVVEMATCGNCGKSWNDALMSSMTPAPSARCPYEYIHEEIKELKALKAFREEADNVNSEWKDGATFIHENYFTDYARQTAEDIGAIDRNANWPLHCIDWDQAAQELQMDYSTVDFDGETYWVQIT